MGLHIAFVANNNTNSLLTTYSGNGKNWGASTPVGSESSKRSPAMAFASSGPQGFTLGFVANDASNQLLVSHSADGVTWKPNTPVQNQSSKAAPALAVFENKLWIAFVANDASNQLLVSHSADGVTWKPNTPVQNQSSKAAPGSGGVREQAVDRVRRQRRQQSAARFPLRRRRDLERQHAGDGSVE